MDKKEYMRIYNANRKESKNAYMREYGKKNGERLKAYHREWHERNKERVNGRRKKLYQENLENERAYARDYYRKNKEKCSKIARNCKLKSKYGITAREYNQLFEDQGGCCVICRRHQKYLKTPLQVDHCHKTGKVRGLLCGRCNRMLGMSKDSIKILKRSILYLKKHQEEVPNAS